MISCGVNIAAKRHTTVSQGSVTEIAQVIMVKRGVHSS